VHIVQVHKETIKVIPNAKEGRESIDFEVNFLNEIFRMNFFSMNEAGNPFE
jgi:hypothetical protein